MKKVNNRKGFTLIELLAVIAIVGLVMGLATFGIVRVVNNSREQSTLISSNNIKEAAKIYSTEKNDDSSYWLDINGEEYKYFCVTIQELINKGLLDKKASLDAKYKPSDYVAIKKNKVTMVSGESEILSEDANKDDENIKTMMGVCGGTIANEVINKYPSFKEETSYTDEIDIPFEDGKAESEITERKCYYGLTSANLSKEGVIDGSICKIASSDGGLKSSTDYYVRVCMTTEKKSKICSDTEVKKTAGLTTPSINVNNSVTITYNDDNIKEGASHYFKSPLDAASNSNVQKCTLDKNRFTCEENTTTTIEKNMWYKTDSSSVVINLTEIGNGKVVARITDRSDNYRESVKEVSTSNTIESVNTTYSCPAGYSCSGGTCTSSSKCEKKVTGEVSEMYYCSHNNSYQASPTCSYTGWENAAFDLGCSTSQTCSDTTYSCPSDSTLNGTNCYMYNRYSCRSGWTSVATGYCEYQCSTANVLLYSHCSGYGVCKSNNAYSCVSTCGSGDTSECRANVSLFGSHPNHICKTTHTIYNCYTPATATKNCVTTGKFYAGNYRGCRLVGSDEVANGFSCSSGNTGKYNDVGTSSCSVSGYTIKRVLDGDCADELKFDKDGVKYCDTANDYWKGQSCTTGSQFGASAIYKLTCSKSGELKYYCDVTDTYSSTEPSDCSKLEYLNVEATKTTTYVCPVGYSATTEDGICIKGS